MEDDNAGIAVYDDDIVVFDCAGGIVKALNGWNFKGSGNDSRMRCLAAEIGYKSLYFFQLYLAGFCRGDVRGNQYDPFVDSGDIHRFCPDKVLHNALGYLYKIGHPTL